ncbi:MAG: TlpA family protein disulfide reductase [Azoarcus sp.]|nr:MAG: TlpA family protein disulfide reductase [Azoarcus sp.]TVT60648.1 MAG: TlpA family protein disulfide reductase [Azoarcus sp. PHD]
MNRYLQYGLIAAVAGIAGIAGYFTSQIGDSAGTSTTSTASAGATEALLALALPDTEGHMQPLAQWRGKVIVANFWATWCPPCRREIPDFSAASRSFGDAPVQFVGLSIDSLDKVKAFKAEFDVPYPLLIASADVLALGPGFGNAAQGLPFTVIIDRQGVARHVKVGTLNQDELERKIRPLIDDKS